MSAGLTSWRQRMERSYDAYFASRSYERRYPGPNPATLDFLWGNGLESAHSILDLGCGNGRYALPVIERGCGSLLGCDISRAAIDAFARRLQGHPGQGRVELLVGGAEALPAGRRFDRILMLFGVLSHVGPRAARVRVLQQLRAHADAGTLLLLTVPSIWRRMPAALLRSLLLPGTCAHGDIEYHRVIDGRPQAFRYHLYGVRDLRRELAEGGWWLRQVDAESVLPEKLVCRSAPAAWIDRVLRRGVPAAFGYGIRAIASPLADIRR